MSKNAQTTQTLTYWDAAQECHVSFDDVTLLWTENGYTSDVEYKEKYRLADGRKLSLTWHRDRGRLATDVVIK